MRLEGMLGVPVGRSTLLADRIKRLTLHFNWIVDCAFFTLCFFISMNSDQMFFNKYDGHFNKLNSNCLLNLAFFLFDDLIV